MMVSPIARADAAFQEQVHAQWRDWCAYLRAHLTLLDAQAAERQGAFERADSLEEQAAQAERDLARLPAGQRALFDQIHETRRQQVLPRPRGRATTAGNGRSIPMWWIARRCCRCWPRRKAQPLVRIASLAGATYR